MCYDRLDLTGRSDELHDFLRTERRSTMTTGERIETTTRKRQFWFVGGLVRQRRNASSETRHTWIVSRTRAKRGWFIYDVEVNNPHNRVNAAKDMGEETQDEGINIHNTRFSRLARPTRRYVQMNPVPQGRRNGNRACGFGFLAKNQ